MLNDTDKLNRTPKGDPSRTFQTIELVGSRDSDFKGLRKNQDCWCSTHVDDIEKPMINDVEDVKLASLKMVYERRFDDLK